MNKKGQFKLIGFGVVVIIAIILLAFFLFSEKLRLIIGGVALVGFGIWAVFKYSKNQKLKTGVILTMFVGGLLLVFFFPALQTVTGISQYEDANGQTHWLVNGIATGIDQGYVFSSLPLQITDSNGNKVKPSEKAILYISKSDSYCEYQLNKVEKTKNLGLTKLIYYELKAPERVANIIIQDDTGTTKTVDGTTKRTESFYDNGGELKITTLGLQAGKQDCQEGSNVALFQDGNNWKALDRGELENRFNSLSIFNSGILGLIDLPNVRQNTAFTSNFKSWDVKNTERFIGQVDIGNIEYVVDADAKYYNSLIIQPEKEANPRISSISVQDKILKDSTSSVIVKITNSGDKGNIVIDASTSNGDISPTSKNAILDKTLSSTFTLKSSNLGNSEICFNVESQQGTNSDKECKSIQIIEEVKDIKAFCGDDICQSNEDYSVCPEDCETPSIDESVLVCDKWYQEQGVKTTYGLNVLGFKAFPKTQEVCKTANWFYLMIAGIIITILGAVALLGGKKK